MTISLAHAQVGAVRKVSVAVCSCTTGRTVCRQFKALCKATGSFHDLLRFYINYIIRQDKVNLTSAFYVD